jgi:ribose/xylose/arabinose/galactoside ABC-type transport system permease subunit
VNARRVRTAAAWTLLVGSLIGWPLSQLTIARDEPPFVLALSWLAIILTSADLLTSSQVHQEQGEDDEGDQRP